MCGATEPVTVVVKGKETLINRPLKGHLNRERRAPVDPATLLRERLEQLRRRTLEGADEQQAAEQQAAVQAAQDK